VPCGSCTACCRDTVVLLPNEGDDLSQYEHVELAGPGPDHAYALRRNEDGACVYLGPKGCTIWDRAPFLCRFFDCRKFFLNRTRQERRDLVRRGLASAEVFKAAGRLLKQERTSSPATSTNGTTV